MASELNVGKVGAGIAPAVPLHAKVSATTGAAPLEVARLEVKDEGVNLVAGMGPKQSFYMPHSTASFEGASIAAKKETGTDADESTALVFSTCPDAGSNTERLTIDSAGNVGIGVAPNAWASGWDSLTLGQATLSAAGAGWTSLSDNAYLNTSSVWSRTSAEEASIYQQNAGVHYFKVAPSGSADSEILTWTDALTIDNAGAVSLSGAASGAAALTIGNTTGGTDLEIIPTENASVTLNASEGATARAMILSTGGTPRLTIDSTGLATFSNGIAFSQTGTAATGAATTSSTLDHYEEGTWTADLNFGGGDTGIVYAANGRQGSYTRIGQIVYVSCIVALSSKGSSSGQAKVSGLPFGVKDNFTSTSVENSISSSYNDVGLGGTNSYAAGSGGHIYLRSASSGNLTNSDFADTSSIRLSGWYITT